MKTVLPWVVALAALAGAYYFFSAAQNKSSDIASLRAIVKDGDQVRDENDALKKIKAQVDDIARLKKDNADAAKLRGEVQQLREDKQSLATQIQAALENLETAKAKIVSSTPIPPLRDLLEKPASPEEMASMKGLGLALIQFAENHNGSFPTNWVGTMETYEGSKNQGKKLSTTEVELLTPALKLNEIHDTASTILARGKFADADGRRTYVFADGHAEIRKDNK